MSVDPRIHYLINADLQQVNQFKLIFIDQLGLSFSGTVGAAASFLVSEYFIQSVTVPSPVTLEYEQSDMKFVKSLKRPDNVSISFLETEDAVVWRFLQNWRKDTVSVAPVSLKSSSFFGSVTGQSEEVTKYMFNDDQTKAMKTGMLFPYSTGKTKIGKFPRIIFRGMRFADNSDLSFSYSESGNLIITASFSINELSTPSVF